MSKSLVLDISKCTGCGYCELICSFAHHDEFNPLKSRIQVSVFIEKSMAVPVVCYQCEDPWCVKACPAGALDIKTDDTAKTRIITVNKEINVPRLPSLRGIARSKSAEITTWGIQELGVDKEMVGLSGSSTQVIKVFFPQRVSDAEILEGEATEQAAKLIDKLKDASLL